MRLVLALALVVAACHRAPHAPAIDALWQLAPEGTELGVVATPHAMAMLARTAGALHALAAVPELARVRGAIDGALAGLLGAPDASFEDAGFATDRGFALFVTADGVLGVLPVADRARFLAVKHGRRGTTTDRVRGLPCRELRGHYVCATSEAMFARLGTGVLRRTVAAALGGTRGDVELYAPDVLLLGAASGDLAATARLSPGAVAIDARWAGAPPAALARLVGARAPHPDPAGAASFATIDVAPLRAVAPPVPLADGVTLAQLAASLRGPVTITVPAGSVDLELRAPLADPGPARRVIEHCGELAFAAPPAATTAPASGTCRFALRGLELDAWLEAGELRIADHRGATHRAPGPAITGAGAALARGAWAAAVWGRGTLLATSQGPRRIERLGPVALARVVDELGAGLAVDRHGVRLHVAVRTLWANPPDVVAKVLAIPTTEGIAARAAAARAIADAAPHSPFAADVAAGNGGLVFPALVLEAAAEVAVPGLDRFLGGDATGASPTPDGAPPDGAPPAATPPDGAAPGAGSDGRTTGRATGAATGAR